MAVKRRDEETETRGRKLIFCMSVCVVLYNSADLRQIQTKQGLHTHYYILTLLQLPLAPFQVALTPKD